MDDLQENVDNTEDNKIDSETNEKASEINTYSTDENGTYKKGVRIANFRLNIACIISMVDCGELKHRRYRMKINFKGRESYFDLPYEYFTAGWLMPAIHRELGPQAYLIGSEKHLVLAVQQSITEEIPHIKISLCTGFDTDYERFLLPGMIITPEKIYCNQGSVVDLSAGNLSRKVKFQLLTKDEIKFLLEHLICEFFALKSIKVTYPILGHVALSPFASWIINGLGKQKYTLHFKGSSGCGKTFMATLLGSFFGSFGDQLTSWSSTANSIETEGYYFRDMIFILDDYKTSVTSPKEITRVLQNYADNRGRGRLNSSSVLQRPPHIRGLLLSTGENFLENVESVSGRTIVLDVEPDHNQVAGEACKDFQSSYNGFIPSFVQWVISDLGWQEKLKLRINQKIADFSCSVHGISNGLRIATNWALNAVGFELFCQFAVHVEAIDDICYRQLISDYEDIVRDHLSSQEASLKAQSPSVQFFSVLGQLLATETVVIQGLVDIQGNPSSVAKTKIIGKLSSDKGTVYIFTELLMSHLVRYFKGVNQVLPFSKDNLRTALAQEGLIIKENDRYAKQVRFNSGRAQAWQFNVKEFKKRCIDVENI